MGACCTAPRRALKFHDPLQEVDADTLKDFKPDISASTTPLERALEPVKTDGGEILASSRVTYSASSSQIHVPQKPDTRPKSNPLDQVVSPKSRRHQPAISSPLVLRSSTSTTSTYPVRSATPSTPTMPLHRPMSLPADVIASTRSPRTPTQSSPAPPSLPSAPSSRMQTPTPSHPSRMQTPTSSNPLQSATSPQSLRMTPTPSLTTTLGYNLPSTTVIPHGSYRPIPSQFTASYNPGSPYKNPGPQAPERYPYRISTPPSTSPSTSNPRGRMDSPAAGVDTQAQFSGMSTTNPINVYSPQPSTAGTTPQTSEKAQGAQDREGTPQRKLRLDESGSMDSTPKSTKSGSKSSRKSKKDKNQAGNGEQHTVTKVQIDPSCLDDPLEPSAIDGVQAPEKDASQWLGASDINFSLDGLVDDQQANMCADDVDWSSPTKPLVTSTESGSKDEGYPDKDTEKTPIQDPVPKSAAARAADRSRSRTGLSRSDSGITPLGSSRTVDSSKTDCMEAMENENWFPMYGCSADYDGSADNVDNDSEEILGRSLKGKRAATLMPSECPVVDFVFASTEKPQQSQLDPPTGVNESPIKDTVDGSNAAADSTMHGSGESGEFEATNSARANPPTNLSDTIGDQDTPSAMDIRGAGTYGGGGSSGGYGTGPMSSGSSLEAIDSRSAGAYGGGGCGSGDGTGSMTRSTSRGSLDRSSTPEVVVTNTTNNMRRTLCGSREFMDYLMPPDDQTEYERRDTKPALQKVQGEREMGSMDAALHEERSLSPGTYMGINVKDLCSSDDSIASLGHAASGCPVGLMDLDNSRKEDSPDDEVTAKEGSPEDGFARKEDSPEDEVTTKEGPPEDGVTRKEDSPEDGLASFQLSGSSQVDQSQHERLRQSNSFQSDHIETKTDHIEAERNARVILESAIGVALLDDDSGAADNREEARGAELWNLLRQRCAPSTESQTGASKRTPAHDMWLSVMGALQKTKEMDCRKGGTTKARADPMMASFDMDVIDDELKVEKTARVMLETALDKVLAESEPPPSNASLLEGRGNELWDRLRRSISAQPVKARTETRRRSLSGMELWQKVKVAIEKVKDIERQTNSAVTGNEDTAEVTMQAIGNYSPSSSTESQTLSIPVDSSVELPSLTVTQPSLIFDGDMPLTITQPSLVFEGDDEPKVHDEGNREQLSDEIPCDVSISSGASIGLGELCGMASSDEEQSERSFTLAELENMSSSDDDNDENMRFPIPNEPLHDLDEEGPSGLEAISMVIDAERNTRQVLESAVHVVLDTGSEDGATPSKDLWARLRRSQLGVPSTGKPTRAAEMWREVMDALENVKGVGYRKGGSNKRCADPMAASFHEDRIDEELQAEQKARIVLEDALSTVLAEDEKPPSNLSLMEDRGTALWNRLRRKVVAEPQMSRAETRRRSASGTELWHKLKMAKEKLIEMSRNQSMMQSLENFGESGADFSQSAFKQSGATTGLDDLQSMSIKAGVLEQSGSTTRLDDLQSMSTRAPVYSQDGPDASSSFKLGSSQHSPSNRSAASSSMSQADSKNLEAMAEVIEAERNTRVVLETAMKEVLQPEDVRMNSLGDGNRGKELWDLLRESKLGKTQAPSRWHEVMDALQKVRETEQRKGGTTKGRADPMAASFHMDRLDDELQAEKKARETLETALDDVLCDSDEEQQTLLEERGHALWDRLRRSIAKKPEATPRRRSLSGLELWQKLRMAKERLTEVETKQPKGGFRASMSASQLTATESTFVIGLAETPNRSEASFQDGVDPLNLFKFGASGHISASLSGLSRRSSTGSRSPLSRSPLSRSPLSRSPLSRSPLPRSPSSQSPLWSSSKNLEAMVEVIEAERNTRVVLETAMKEVLQPENASVTDSLGDSKRGKELWDLLRESKLGKTQEPSRSEGMWYEVMDALQKVRETERRKGGATKGRADPMAASFHMDRLDDELQAEKKARETLETALDEVLCDSDEEQQTLLEERGHALWDKLRRSIAKKPEVTPRRRSLSGLELWQKLRMAKERLIELERKQPEGGFQASGTIQPRAESSASIVSDNLALTLIAETEPKEDLPPSIGANSCVVSDFSVSPSSAHGSSREPSPRPGASGAVQYDSSAGQASDSQPPVRGRSPGSGITVKLGDLKRDTKEMSASTVVLGELDTANQDQLAHAPKTRDTVSSKTSDVRSTMSEISDVSSTSSSTSSQSKSPPLPRKTSTANPIPMLTVASPTSDAGSTLTYRVPSGNLIKFGDLDRDDTGDTLGLSVRSGADKEETGDTLGLSVPSGASVKLADLGKSGFLSSTSTIGASTPRGRGLGRSDSTVQYSGSSNEGSTGKFRISEIGSAKQGDWDLAASMGFSFNLRQSQYCISQGSESMELGASDTIRPVSSFASTAVASNLSSMAEVIDAERDARVVLESAMEQVLKNDPAVSSEDVTRGRELWDLLRESQLGKSRQSKGEIPQAQAMWYQVMDALQRVRDHGQRKGATLNRLDLMADSFDVDRMAKQLRAERKARETLEDALEQELCKNEGKEAEGCGQDLWKRLRSSILSEPEGGHPQEQEQLWQKLKVAKERLDELDRKKRASQDQPIQDPIDAAPTKPDTSIFDSSGPSRRKPSPGLSLDALLGSQGQRRGTSGAQSPKPVPQRTASPKPPLPPSPKAPQTSAPEHKRPSLDSSRESVSKFTPPRSFGTDSRPPSPQQENCELTERPCCMLEGSNIPAHISPRKDGTTTPTPTPTQPHRHTLTDTQPQPTRPLRSKSASLALDGLLGATPVPRARSRTPTLTVIDATTPVPQPRSRTPTLSVNALLNQSNPSTSQSASPSPSQPQSESTGTILNLGHITGVDPRSKSPSIRSRSPAASLKLSGLLGPRHKPGPVQADTGIAYASANENPSTAIRDRTASTAVGKLDTAEHPSTAIRASRAASTAVGRLDTTTCKPDIPTLALQESQPQGVSVPDLNLKKVRGKETLLIQIPQKKEDALVGGKLQPHTPDSAPKPHFDSPPSVHSPDSAQSPGRTPKFKTKCPRPIISPRKPLP